MTLTDPDLRLNSLPAPCRDLLRRSPGAYLVGGCVRDALLGRSPADYDLAVKTDPAGFAARLARRAGGRVVVMGKPGTRIYRVPFGEIVFDVSPLEGPDIEADLRRRDFTINAMALEPAAGRIIDPTGGRADLGRRIRMVSEAAFRRDPLRMLRAFRLAAGLGLAIESGTLSAIAAHRDQIRTIAGERIREELLKFFRSGASVPHLDRMADSGLLEAILPELTPLRRCRPNRHHRFDAFTHTLAAYGHLERVLTAPAENFPGVDVSIPPREAALLKWTMLLHDIGKPAAEKEDASGVIRYNDHSVLGADLAAAVCWRLRCSREEERFITEVIRRHLGPLQLFTLHEGGRLSRRAVSRFFIRNGDRTPYVLIHGLGDYLGKGRSDEVKTRRFRAFIRMMMDRFYGDFKEKSGRPPLITGRDLIRELKLTPSPVFSRILQGVETARLEGTVRTREEALRMAADLLAAADDA